MVFVKGFSLVQKYIGNKEIIIKSARNLHDIITFLNEKFGLKIEFYNNGFFLMGKPIIIYVNGIEAMNPQQKVLDSDFVMVFPVIDGG